MLFISDHVFAAFLHGLWYVLLMLYCTLQDDLNTSVDRRLWTDICFFDFIFINIVFEDHLTICGNSPKYEYFNDIYFIVI